MPARALVDGSATGFAIVLDEPLSFWGGMDPGTGRVLVMPSGRGSSSSSSVLAEAIRAGTSPAAIVLLEPDPIVALGAVVARELYGRTVPVVVAADASAILTGREVEVTASGAAAEVRLR